MDWSKLPDLLAVGLLASAFASVARRSQSAVSGIWLTGWVLIALHFAASIAAPVAGKWGLAATFISLVALAWAGVLFTFAAVPYSKEPSRIWMLTALFSAHALYIGLIVFSQTSFWFLVPAAIYFGAGPLAVTAVALPKFSHPLRWTTVLLGTCLSLFLLAFQFRPGIGFDLALNAVFFTVYFQCCIYSWYVHRNRTTGAFITFAGFVTWASVFVIAPAMQTFLPAIHLETEVWNLPKYVVAVGMILLELEDQIEHNRHLALHDELTGLPNRRLFLDRLNSALERARRSGYQTALLLIDLNEFKHVNDSVGHHVGDVLLQRVSEIFSGRVRRSDTVARTGGDEFSIILEEPTSREDAERVADSLIRLLSKPFEIEGHPVHVGASVGIAVYPNDAQDAESLRIAADLRMYSVKFETKEAGAKMAMAQLSPSMALPRINPREGMHLVD